MRRITAWSWRSRNPSQRNGRAAPPPAYPGSDAKSSGSDAKSDKALGSHDPSADRDCVTLRALRST